MNKFEGYEGIVPDQRWKNELLEHLRKQTELLEQIAQLLKTKESGNNVTGTTEGISLDSVSERQPRQRRGYGGRKRGEG